VQGRWQTPLAEQPAPGGGPARGAAERDAGASRIDRRAEAIAARSTATLSRSKPMPRPASSIPEQAMSAAPRVGPRDARKTSSPTSEPSRPVRRQAVSTFAIQQRGAVGINGRRLDRATWTARPTRSDRPPAASG
jgi:hypothetical protein